MSSEHPISSPRHNISSEGWPIKPGTLELKRLLRLALDLNRIQRKRVAYELEQDPATISRWLSDEDHREMPVSVLIEFCKLTRDYAPLSELCRQAGGTFYLHENAPEAPGA